MENCIVSTPDSMGSLEMSVMDIIWEKSQPCSVGEIQTDLSSQNSLAYTTIMTVMSNLYKKGILGRAKAGKAYVYWPIVARQEIGRKLGGKIQDSLFGGKLSQFVACMLGSETLSKDDILKLRAELDAAEDRLKSDD